jgi:hypothetical protein
MTRRYYTSNERKQLKRAAALGLSAAVLAGAAIFLNRNLHYDDSRTYTHLEERLTQAQEPVTQPQITNSSGLEEQLVPDEEGIRVKQQPEKQKPKASFAQPKKPIDAGIVVSSNENLQYARLNIDILKNNNYQNAYLEKIKAKGKTMYRVIVGVNYDDIDPLMDDLRAKNLVGEPDKYFRVRGKEVASLAKESPKQAAKRDEKIMNEFRSVVKDKTRDGFVGLYAPVVKELYTKGTISDSRVKDIVGHIYDAAKEFKVPLADQMGIIAQESVFGKMPIGDINRGTDYSSGLGHILMGTLEDIVYPGMRKKHVPGIPDTFYKFLKEYKQNHELQARSSAFYFRICLEEAGHRGSGVPTDSKIIRKGVAKYNAGHNSDSMNRKYTNEIDERKREMEQKKNRLYPNSASGF